MSIIVSDTGGGDYELPEAGVQNAVCTNVYDIGMQPGYMGKLQHKVVILFEIEQRFSEGDLKGKRMTIPNTYTASLSDRANLRAHLESWRGRGFTDAELEGFDLERLRGVPCLLAIVHNESKGRTYANVSAVMKHSKNYEALQPELGPDYIPNWVKNKLQEAGPEVDGAPAPTSSPGFEDDIPF